MTKRDTAEEVITIIVKDLKLIEYSASRFEFLKLEYANSFQRNVSMQDWL